MESRQPHTHDEEQIAGRLRFWASVEQLYLLEGRFGFASAEGEPTRFIAQRMELPDGASVSYEVEPCRIEHIDHLPLVMQVSWPSDDPRGCCVAFATICTYLVMSGIEHCVVQPPMPPSVALPDNAIAPVVQPPAAHIPHAA